MNNTTDIDSFRSLPEKQQKPQHKQRWFVLKAAYSSVPHREKLMEAGFKFFLPTYFEMQNVAGRKVRVERPSVMNFIFVYAKCDEILEYVQFVSGLTALRKHRPLHEHSAYDEDEWLLSIPDIQMECFMRSIAVYDKEVPFLKPEEVELEKGDYVRIVGGPFEGAEGILRTSQGKEGGKVLVSIGNILMLQTLEIEPKYIQVLRFAKKGKHLYKKFDSFLGKGRTALDHFFNPVGVSMAEKVKDQTNMRQFVERFSELETPTVNARLKLQAYLLICYTYLADDEKQQMMIGKLLETLQTVNSDIFRAFGLAMLYRCTQESKYQRMANDIVRTWGELKQKDKQKREIIEDLK